MKILALLIALARAGHHAECLEEAHNLLFLHEDPLRKNAGNPDVNTAGIIVERSTDYCALKEGADKKYFCKYFALFVADAFKFVHEDTPVTPASFCKLVEDHANRMLNEVEGVRLYRLNEVVNDTTCIADVDAAMSPDTAIAQDKVADFWYLFCIHYHDCEAVIPSRTKWCMTSKVPALSKSTCELLRADVVELTEVKPMAAYDAKTLCDWFLGFAGVQAENLEAYEYVMYGIVADPSIIEPMSQSQHALQNSRLENGANAHWIRDHSAHPVTYSALASAKRMGAQAIHSLMSTHSFAPMAAAVSVFLLA
jgi:hypothetical protein